MSQPVDEDMIFDDVYELCEVIGRLVETTKTYNFAFICLLSYGCYFMAFIGTIVYYFSI